ncbi:MAG: zinc ABC transporter substrate-binding protein [Pseudomonadota bacterium]
MISRRSLLASAATIASISMTLPTTVWSEEPIPVVATFSILGDMVQRIGGEHIALTTLVGPDGDAHVYQPTPQDARAVSEAEILFMNGLEFEGWLERLAESASFDGKMVVATTGVTPIAFDEHDEEGHHDDEHGAHDDHGDDHAAKEDHDDHGDEHAEHDDHGEDHAGHDDHGEDHAGHDHGHDHGAFDPHAWQSLDAAVIYVDNITAALSVADPDNANEYYANRATYVAEIEALEEEIHELMDALPEDKRTFVTSHDAFGYFAAAYDLTFKAPQGLSTESEASAADVASLITQIREEGISAVFVESITDNRLMEQIANETGATIGGTLYSDALSGEDGPASTYLDMMRHNATTMSQAIGG